MANAQKYTRAACGHLAAHYERKKDEKGEYIKFGNQDIDPQKTHLNYNLAPRRGLEQIDFIRQRTTEARTLKRDDVNVMCSWVVTLPEYRHHNQNLHVSPDKEQVERLFFERTYRFLCDRYGEQNVVSAYVHKDISIHALLAESDPKIFGLIFSDKKFLSTLSLRRATLQSTPIPQGL